MYKRQFLALSALASATPLLQAAPRTAAGPALLTVTGAIGRSNRGPFDPALDQMMHKHQLSFERAYTFDYAALARLPAVDIHPTLEYDGKVHHLRGPLLTDVLHAAGAPERSEVTLRAVDGFAVQLNLQKIRQRRYLVAMAIDGAPMALGGLGPLWAVFDAERVADLAARPPKERFGECPWALYYIGVTS